MSRLRVIRALIVPAAQQAPCAVQALPVTAQALSDAIGGGPLDDAVYGAVGSDVLAYFPIDVRRGGYCVYLDEARTGRGLPLNDRAAMLGEQLGWPSENSIVLRGDVLVVGATQLAGNDTDVPDGVLTAARRGGLLDIPITVR